MCWAEKKQPKITSQSPILGSRLKPDMPALFLCPFKIDFWLPLASRVLFSLCPSPHMWSHQPHHKPSPSTFVLSWRNTCQHTNGFSKHSFPLEQSSSTGHGAAWKREQKLYFTGWLWRRCPDTQVLQALCLLSWASDFCWPKCHWASLAACKAGTAVKGFGELTWSSLYYYFWTWLWDKKCNILFIILIIIMHVIPILWPIIIIILIIVKQRHFC